MECLLHPCEHEPSNTNMNMAVEIASAQSRWRGLRDYNVVQVDSVNLKEYDRA